ncbi:MAG: SAM-dependent methyltransferase [Burkholderiaceae bacterium]|nr:SAM-dependent methyltransferase [Burkholderiaceae bacterium]
MTVSGYQTTQQPIAIPGVNDLVIRSLLDNQQYYDPTGAAQRLGISSAHWSLFGLLWPSGVQLATQLASRPVSLNERILEIGCGLGLASLVGQRRGAHITASDRHPLTRTFLKKNAHLNGLPVLKYRHGQWGSVGPDPCEQDTDAQLLSARYDLIIGSDLLYERGMAQDVASFINDHAFSAAEVWMMDPSRGYRPEFNRHMAAYGFQLQHDTQLHQTLTDGDGAEKDHQTRFQIFRRTDTGLATEAQRMLQT